MTLTVVVSEEVRDALAERRGVVALESTIFSHLGLPSPANGEALARCEAAIRRAGAVPAVTAVLDGVARVGLAEHERDRILGHGLKVAERDLSVAIAKRYLFGATTVSASLALAHLAGVRVFATGGIGGVHRGAELTFDISADLDALASRPLVAVSAGAKAFLDLSRTLEYLETRHVAVLGWGTDEFPAFYTRTSGFAVSARVDGADQVAAVYANRARAEVGVLVVVPIPAEAELDRAELDAALTSALDDADRAGVRGAPLTPFVLARIAAATEGRSVPANLALAEHNASVAALIANAIAVS